jgi:hypothetical protein
MRAGGDGDIDESQRYELGLASVFLSVSIGVIIINK